MSLNIRAPVAYLWQDSKTFLMLSKERVKANIVLLSITPTCSSNVYQLLNEAPREFELSMSFFLGCFLEVRSLYRVYQPPHRFMYSLFDLHVPARE